MIEGRVFTSAEVNFFIGVRQEGVRTKETLAEVYSG